MDQQPQQPQAPQPPQQPQQQVPAQGGAPVEPQKKSNVWLWVLGGCLGFIILSILIVTAIGWFAAKKIKKEIDENKPQFEQFIEDAEEYQKQAEELQKNDEQFQEQAEDFQGQLENIPTPVN